MPRGHPAADEDAPEPSEPRSQRGRRPTRKTPAASRSPSSPATPSRRGRLLASKTVLSPQEDVNGQPVAMESASDDGGRDVVMQDPSETEDETAPSPEPEPATTTPRRRGRPARPNNGGETPTKSLRTPVKLPGSMRPAAFTPGRAADRSARKKSARALITHALRDGGSDDEHAGDQLAREIYEESSDDAEDESDDDDDDKPATPSRRPRGRPAGSGAATTTTTKKRTKRARSPTPPRDLPRHEAYFAQNKPGRPKTSDARLAPLALLTEDEYLSLAGAARDRHAGDIAFLEALHAESFPQWAFELSQGFSVCLYGLGSKRALLHRFAAAVHSRGGRKPAVVVMVNGHAPATSNLREILAVVGAAVGAPASTAQAIAAHLSSSSSAGGPSLTLAVNSVDAPPLRKPGAQAALARLAAHPRVHLVCTADTPDFPLLWDMGVRSAFNFVFHDCTTFARFAPADMDVVAHVHELLGRQARRANGRDGVAFVLRSLTDNAKGLFRLLVGEALVAMDDGGGGDAEDAAGLEYRMVYNKAVEEFICSSEMAFRTLLKEFHDHQMITSRKDALGTELLSLPFRREDLEAILEDLSM